MELGNEIPDVDGQTYLEEQIAEASTPSIARDVIEEVHTFTRRIILANGPILETAQHNRKRQFEFRADRAVIAWTAGESPETITFYGRRILATGKYGADLVSRRYPVEEMPEWFADLLAAAPDAERRP